MTRRTFLITSLSLLFFPKKALTLSQPEMPDKDILRGLLNALIPSDDTAGAREAKLYEKLTGLISEDSKKRSIYDAGFSMVRKEIKRAQGATVDWDAVLGRISTTSFFRELRRDALWLFYSDPIGWKSVGYKGPPLVGYSDYHKCE